MIVKSNQPNHQTLYDLAAQQAGYFTAQQAQGVGFSRPLLVHHTKTGLFERTQHGIYRLTRFPSSAYEDLFVAWLRIGPKSVISHDSALALYGLSDALPTQIHLTAPRGVSLRRNGIRLHSMALRPDETSRWEGLPVTSVARTIADVTKAGMQLWLAEQAVRQALQRGLLLPEYLEEQANRSSQRVQKVLLELLAQAKTVIEGAR